MNNNNNKVQHPQSHVSLHKMCEQTSVNKIYLMYLVIILEFLPRIIA